METKRTRNADVQTAINKYHSAMLEIYDYACKKGNGFTSADVKDIIYKDGRNLATLTFMRRAGLLGKDGLTYFFFEMEEPPNIYDAQRVRQIALNICKKVNGEPKPLKQLLDEYTGTIAASDAVTFSSTDHHQMSTTLVVRPKPTVEECIEILKDNGYKVYRQEWTEL